MGVKNQENTWMVLTIISFVIYDDDNDDDYKPGGWVAMCVARRLDA